MAHKFILSFTVTSAMTTKGMLVCVHGKAKRQEYKGAFLHCRSIFFKKDYLTFKNKKPIPWFVTLVTICTSQHYFQMNNSIFNLPKLIFSQWSTLIRLITGPILSKITLVYACRFRTIIFINIQ